MKRNSVANLILVVCFFILMILPIVFINLKPGKISRAENRYLASFPSRYDDAGNRSATYWSDLRAWFDDNLGFRDQYIKLSQWIDYHIIGKSPSTNVSIGKDGWFFFTPDYNLEIAKGLYPLTDEMIADIAVKQSKISEYMTGRGIEYVLALPPSKPGLYPEYLPFDAEPAERLFTPSQKLADFLNKSTNVHAIALRPSLLEAKNNGEKVFFKTDTHWTEAGAYRAYLSMLEGIPELTTPSAKVSYYTTERLGDLANMMGVSSSMELEEVPCTEVVSPCAVNITEEQTYRDLIDGLRARGVTTVKCFSNTAMNDAPRIMIYGDSMFENWNIAELLAENASDLIYIRNSDIMPDEIDSFAPDIVIYEMGERSLLSLPNTSLDLLEIIDDSHVTDDNAVSGSLNNAFLSGDMSLREEDFSYAYLINGDVVDVDLNRGDTISIEGWMTDADNEKTSSAVYIQIGETTFALDLAERIDVADHFGNPALVNAGFRGSIDTTGFPAGEYVPVFYFDMGDDSYYRLEAGMKICVLDSSQPSDEDFYCDYQLNGLKEDFEVHRGDTISVEGWMVEGDKEHDADSVIVQIGEAHFEMNKAERIDVGDFFGNPALNNAGFRGEISTDEIEAGSYTPVFVFTTSSGKCFTVEAQFTVSIQ